MWRKSIGSFLNPLQLVLPPDVVLSKRPRPLLRLIFPLKINTKKKNYRFLPEIFLTKFNRYRFINNTYCTIKRVDRIKTFCKTPKKKKLYLIQRDRILLVLSFVSNYFVFYIFSI